MAGRDTPVREAAHCGGLAAAPARGSTCAVTWGSPLAPPLPPAPNGDVPARGEKPVAVPVVVVGVAADVGECGPPPPRAPCALPLPFAAARLPTPPPPPPPPLPRTVPPWNGCSGKDVLRPAAAAVWRRGGRPAGPRRGGRGGVDESGTPSVAGTGRRVTRGSRKEGKARARATVPCE